MGKPTKGNKTKRPPSDEMRLKVAHLNNLKKNKAIVSSSFEVPEGFKAVKINNNKDIRLTGVGAQAIKLASNKHRDEVVKAVADRNWTRIVTLIPREDALPINYKLDKEGKRVKE